MTRADFIAAAKEIGRKRAAIWEAGQAKYLAARSCSLGMCVRTKTLDRTAQIADTLEKRKAAKEHADAMRAEMALPWQEVIRLVEQLQVAEHVLKECADGELREV